MAKQLNKYEVQLDFKADTSQAKKEIQNLQQNLNNAIMKAGTANVGQNLSKDLSGAIATASKLKIQLEEAFNVDTGRLDLGKFKQSMDQSGLSLEKYQQQLSLLGPEGEQAFRQLASSIVQAEVPLKRSNALLTEFATTLKNTARWQISSSLLHGFMGAIHSAYGYAQDLNESLNNIRIVTGYSTDKMAEFAANANKAAQALSTTTTAYTDAALIYYQQGLGDEEVLGRTDVTVKMANVSRQSAEEVSDQLTAIWNNFYDGSKSLEYYADVITALGAATASSSEEISTGLEKFAAVADTVGLSYEYATAALATITATTRQSAETVGTGLRTLFARLEGLKLGETLEDGVDLNKYSKALETVGVQILDVNGEIKDMDTILDETAAKWDTLSKAQQVAFAQTVGGVRQYTNLIALMDNWDFMQSNLGVAGGAEGTLQKQADVYAESWEAAQKRVKAAAEELYNTILDDKFFIELNKLLADTIHGFTSLIKGMGGVGGILTTIGSAILVLYRDNIAKSIDDTIYRFKLLTKAGQEAYEQEKQKANSMLMASYEGKKDVVSVNMREAVGQQIVAQEQYLKNANKMTDAERKRSSELLNQQQVLIKNVELGAQELKQLQSKVKIDTRKFMSSLSPTQTKALGKENGAQAILNMAKNTGEIDAFIDNLAKIDIESYKSTEAIQLLNTKLGSLEEAEKKFNVAFGKDGVDAYNKFKQALESDDIEKVKESLENLFAVQATAKNEYVAKLEDLVANGLNEEQAKIFRQLAEEAYKAGYAVGDVAEQQNILSNFTQRLGTAFADLAAKNTTLTQSLVSFTGSLTSLAMAANTIRGVISVWGDESVSTGQKVLQTVTSLGIAINILSRIQGKETLAHLANIGVKTAAIVTGQKNTISLTAETIATEGLTAATLSYIAVATLGIAAIVGLIYVIYKLVTAEERQAKQLKETQEKAKELSDQYKELKNNAEEFQETIKDYREGLVALQDLEGEQEDLNKAIEESNKKARELIETYKLFNDYTLGNNGEIIISDEALDRVAKEKSLQAASARGMAATANINALSLGNTQSYNKIDYDNYWNKFSEEQNQLLIDEYEKYLTASGGISDTDQFINYLNKDTEFVDQFGDHLSQLNTNLSERGIKSLEDYHATLDKSTDGLRHWTNELYAAEFEAENYDKIKKLSTVNGEFDQGRYNLLTTVGGLQHENVISNIADTSGVTNRQGLSDFIASGHTEAAIKLLGENWGEAISKGNLVGTYAALANGGSASDYDVTKNSSGQYTAKNIYTEETAVNELTEDAVAKLLAAKIAVAEAMEDFNYDQFFPQLETIVLAADEAGQQYGVDFSGALLSSLANGKGSLQDLNLASIFGGLSEDEWSELKTLTPEELAKLFGITKENLAALGLNSVQEFYDKFQEALGDAYSDVDFTETINAEYQKKAEKLDLDVDAFEAYKRILQETNPELAKNVELLNKVALADKRVERGAKTLIDNWEEWNEIITRVGDNSQDLSTILPKVEEALADIANVNIEDIQELDPSFISENWDLITQSINGSETALDELQAKIAEVTLNNWIAEIGIDDAGAIAEIQSLHDEITSFNDFPIEVPINNEDFINACNDMILAAQMTEEQAQEYFSKLGFDATFKTQKQPVTEWVPNYESRYEVVEEGEGYRIQKKGTNVTWERFDGEVEVPAIETITPNKSYGGNIKKLGGGGGGPKKSGGGGGGGKSSPAENQKVTSKDDAGIKRYKEIDDAINDLAKDQERLNKVTDAYYGADKVAYMKQQQKLLQKEIDLHKERFKWAQKYYEEDKAELDNYAKEKLGVEIEYDEDGSIKNYTPIMESLYSQLNEKEKFWSKASNFKSKEEQDEYKKNNIDPIADTMKTFQGYVDQFDESNEERKKEMNEGIELMIEFKQHEYEIWQEGWKNQQDILEDQIKFLDHAKKMLGDSAADMGEALALTAGGDNNYVQNALDQLTLYKDKEQELHDLYAKGKITKADYVKGMEEIRDGYLEQTENLKALDDEMMEYYGKVLDKVISEIKEYTDAMGKLNDQLDRYMKVMKLTGRELDYNAIGEILEAQQKVLQDQYTTDLSTLEMLREREQHWIQELKNQNTEEGKELIERQLKETREQIVETENQVLDDLAAQAEKAAEILENARAKSMAVYEDMLTDGLGFDYIDGLLERQSTIQEEYLTKTNQVFETTKMLRKIQTDMDSTSNRAAKERLNNFSKEIENLKNRDKMTKADLELAQKRYDLLLAQIALEEAQKAKTTVRLQRDNEGNYGYVYTADEGDIAKAEDDMFNAENDLYNTRLRIANEYGEKIIQLNQEQADALNELWDEYYNKHSISEDEYEQKRAEIVDHYNELRKTYVHNYTEAQKEDARVVADAWINQDKNMIKSSTEWQKTTDKLISQTETAIRRYENTSDWLERQQERHLGNVREETEKVTTASDELKDKVNDEVIPAYKDLWDKVDAVYKKYSAERSEVLKNIKVYNDLATSLQTTIDKYRTLADVSDIKTLNSDGNVKGTNGNVKNQAGNASAGGTAGGGGNGGNNNPGYIPDNNLGKQEVKKVEQKPAQDTTLQAYLSTLNSNPSGLSDAGITYIVNKLGASSTAGQKALAIRSKRDEYNHLVSLGDNLVKNKTKYQRFQTLAAEKAAGKFNTGGYTGEWSDGSGKLAVLHSKELVLNAKDTENMLAVVDMVRQITNSIDMNAASLAGGYGALSSGGSGATGPQTLEQNVQITASFPNATNHSEIEEAFNNLINKASQYANRR